MAGLAVDCVSSYLRRIEARAGALAGVIVFAVLCVPHVSFGCVWVHGTTLDGMPQIYSPGGRLSILKRAMEETPQVRLEAILSHQSDAEQKSSEEELKAVEAIVLGDPHRAISLLEGIEKATPGLYSTAANLGTAYELAGDNAKALKWITEGVARNRESHYGTEWLHQQILETKIRLAADPQYLTSHRVISLPERFNNDTRVEVKGSERTVKEIAWAINYQLRERMVFVKPPDPVVADLLFTLGEIEAHIGAVESAFPFLEIARLYGFADPSLLLETTNRYKAAIFLGWIYILGTGVFLASAFFGGLYFLYRKKVFFLTRSAHEEYRKAKAEGRGV